MKGQIKNILLIDDDQDDKYFFTTALDEVNPEVSLVTAAEGGEAFRKLAENRPDLILLDLVMPGINGIKFLKMIKRDPLYSNIPVIVYTSDLSIFDEEEVLELGAEQVLLKANDFTGTVENIARILNTSTLRQSA